MTAPHPASSGRPDGTQASVQAGQPETAVPQQRQADMGRGTVEEVVVERRLTSLGRKSWLVVLTAAVGCVAVGVLLLAWPSATLTIVAILLGASLLVSGLLRLFDGFTARGETGGMRAAYIVIGLLAILAGLYCLRHRDVTIFLLALLVGAYWIVHGVADLAVAVTSGPMPGRGLRVVGGLFSLADGCGRGNAVWHRPAITGVCRMRGPAEGRPEQTAGGSGGRSPPVWGSGGYPPDVEAPRSGGPGVTPRASQQVEATAAGYGGAA